MGNLLISILNMLSLKTAAAAAVVTTFNIKQVEDFVNGLLTGLVQDDSLDKVKACLTDAKSVETDMSAAIADFKKGDVADIIAGITQIGHLLSTVDADISDCKGMQDDAARIKKWSAIFSNPSQLAQTVLANALANMTGLKADIAQIPTDVSKDDFKDLGLDIADIMTKTLGPVPQSELSADSFPSFDSLHANCAMQTTIAASCADTYAALGKTVASPSWDPAHGLYAVHQEVENKSIWVTRTTPTKHYVDDIEFVLTDSGSSCSVSAKSRSETLSYYDYDTNYCYMYNVFKSSGVSFSPVTTSECKWVPAPADVEATCNKY